MESVSQVATGDSRWRDAGRASVEAPEGLKGALTVEHGAGAVAPGSGRRGEAGVDALGKAAQVVRDGVSETLTYMGFPREHWRCIRTNNPMERLNREVRRRTRVVGAFPDGQSALMLIAARLRHVAGTKWGLPASAAACSARSSRSRACTPPRSSFAVPDPNAESTSCSKFDTSPHESYVRVLHLIDDRAAAQGGRPPVPAVSQARPAHTASIADIADAYVH